MRMRNLAFGLSMTLGVQLMPGYWVKDDEYLIPNSQYVPKGGPGYQNKTGSKGETKTGTSDGSGASGGAGNSGNSGGSGAGGGGSGGSGGSGSGGSGSGNGGGGSTGSGGGDGCGLVEANAPLESDYFGPKWETNLNDALPYDWARKYWLCGCPAISLEGSGLYWQSRPLIMCIL